jgi:hypothetical protein
MAEKDAQLHKEVVNTTQDMDQSDAELQEAINHHDDAIRVIRPITDALKIIPTLCEQIRDLRRRLALALADLHDLIAAAKATLGAHADGEPDFYYLRDELEAQGHVRRDREQGDEHATEWL